MIRRQDSSPLNVGRFLAGAIVGKRAVDTRPLGRDDVVGFRRQVSYPFEAFFAVERHKLHLISPVRRGLAPVAHLDLADENFLRGSVLHHSGVFRTAARLLVLGWSVAHDFDWLLAGSVGG